MARGKPIEIVLGTVFGRLTVIGAGRSGRKSYGRVYPCRCQCGKEVEVRGGYLVAAIVRSCGCLRRDSMRLRAMAPRDPKHREHIRVTMKAKAEREKRLAAVEQSPPPASGYADKPARPLRPKREAVQALAAAFGLTVQGAKR